MKILALSISTLAILIAFAAIPSQARPSVTMTRMYDYDHPMNIYVCIYNVARKLFIKAQPEYIDEPRWSEFCNHKNDQWIFKAHPEGNDDEYLI